MQRIVRYMKNDSLIEYGVIKPDDKIIPIKGDLFNSWYLTNDCFEGSEVKLLSPCMPSKIVGVGLNYHCVLNEKGEKIPSEPTIFLKPSSSVIGPEDYIVIPEGCESVGFEGELAVVIGKKAKNVTLENAYNYILGYTCANDVTAANYMTKGEPWTKGKGFDTFTPLGPAILTGKNIPCFNLKVYQNKVLRQDQTTTQMIFNSRQLLEYISHIMTLYPGDVIITGTPTGKGKAINEDLVMVKIENIGCLENRVCKDVK